MIVAGSDVEKVMPVVLGMETGIRGSVRVDVSTTPIVGRVGSVVVNGKDGAVSNKVESPPEGTSSDRGVDETAVGMDTPQPVRNILRDSSQARTHLVVKVQWLYSLQLAHRTMG